MDFCATDLFLGTFIDLRFMFIEALMKDLASMLTHVCKIFNWRVSFKILLSMCFVTAEKELSKRHFQKKLP